MTKTTWIDKKTGKALPGRHLLTCPGGDCTGCYGDGRFGIPGLRYESTHPADEQLAKALRALRHQFESVRYPTRNPDAPCYRELLGDLRDAFALQMAGHARDARDLREAKGLSRGGLPEFAVGIDDQGMPIFATIAARAVLAGWLRQRGGGGERSTAA